MKSLLHREVWQRLPQGPRQRALFGAATLLAPRPGREVLPSGPIIVAGALRTASGLGQSARLGYEALRLAGVEVFGVDLTAALMQPLDAADFDFADGSSLVGPGTLILHVNAPLVPLAFIRLGRRLVADKYVVGYWAWELPALPADWRHGIRFVHEVWVPSRFVAQAISSMSFGRPVRVVPHPVALSWTTPVNGSDPPPMKWSGLMYGF
jgi:hypothetical protein